MMGERSGVTTEQRTIQSIDGTLEPFPGRFIPGVCFESDHCFWLLEFASTPTEFDSYTELWMITPDGERVLFTDPNRASQEVLAYHDFDRTEGATIAREQITSETVAVTMNGNDGTSLDLELTLGRTLETRILNTVIALSPALLLRSRVGTTVSTLLLNLLLDANGLRVAGQTETGRRYRLDADRLLSVTNATATLDGTDLGELQLPGRPVEFGDAKTTAEALYISGELYLERLDD